MRVLPSHSLSARRSFAFLFLSSVAFAARLPPPLGAPCTRSTPTSISGAPYSLVGADSTALCAVHDPSLVEEDGVLYLFSTDTGHPSPPPFLAIRTSKDNGTTWATSGAVFSAIPSWALALVPRAVNIWAPDASWSPMAQEWRVYYAVSSFGSQSSVIGLVVTPSLAFPRWVDHGLVLQSSAEDNFNAIDPTLVDGPAPWLVFGSFWSGIKALRIDASTGKASAASTVVSLAQRSPPDALEGAFVVQRPDAAYLFTSWDACCRGVKSTYSVHVGRSTRGIEGPFVDSVGIPLLQGGGTRVIGGGHGWAAGGGEGFLRMKSGASVSSANVSTMVLHAYDGVSGDPFLQLVSVRWGVDGWPAVE